MNEAQRLGMERLSRANGETVIHKLFIFRRGCSFQNLVSTITLIVEQRMPDIFHMDTYLMRTPGFEAAFHQCDIAQTFQNGIVGDRRLALISFGENRHLHAVTRITADIAFDPSFVVAYDTPYERPVFTFGRFVEKLQTEVCFSFRLFSDNQQAGSIFIDTMNESEGGIVRIVCRIIFQIPSKGIHQCAGIVPMSGVYDQSGRLIDHQQIVIFLYDFYRNIFREISNVRGGRVIIIVTTSSGFTR